MNANDLADRLEQFYQGTHITKAAETLREQQAEIEALKKQIPDWGNINKPNPFIGMSEDPNYKPLPSNSGLGGSALKKAREK
jgi:hypothetical protein